MSPRYSRNIHLTMMTIMPQHMLSNQNHAMMMIMPQHMLSNQNHGILGENLLNIISW